MRLCALRPASAFWSAGKDVDKNYSVCGLFAKPLHTLTRFRNSLLRGKLEGSLATVMLSLGQADRTDNPLGRLASELLGLNKASVTPALRGEKLPGS